MVGQESKKMMYLERHLEAIKRKGLQSIDLDQLLKLLEISRGSFYNYFQTKTNYLVDLVARIKEKSFEQVTQLEASSKQDYDVLVEQLVLKFSLEAAYDIEKMQLYLTMQQKREPALGCKVSDLKELDVEWMATRFHDVFGYDSIYCREAATLFLAMMYELMNINSEATVQSPLRHFVQETLHYAQLIMAYNVEKQQTLFFDNEQSLLARLKWERMSEILSAQSHTFSEENETLVQGLIEELSRKEVRPKIVNALIEALDGEGFALKHQLLDLLAE